MKQAGFPVLSSLDKPALDAHASASPAPDWTSCHSTSRPGSKDALSTSTRTTYRQDEIHGNGKNNNGHDKDAVEDVHRKAQAEDRRTNGDDAMRIEYVDNEPCTHSGDTMMKAHNVVCPSQGDGQERSATTDMKAGVTAPVHTAATAATRSFDSVLPNMKFAMTSKTKASREAFERCSLLLKRMPPMDAPLKFQRSWSIQEALDQHAALAKQADILLEIGRNRSQVRQTQLSFADLEVEECLHRAQRVLYSPEESNDAGEVYRACHALEQATQDLRLAARLCKLEEAVIQNRTALADLEVDKARNEMRDMKTIIDSHNIDMTVVLPTPKGGSPPPGRKFFYCTNCKVGGHGQRFAEYLLKRPNWRIYPYQRWFEDAKSGQFYCPLGKKMVDFSDESQFSAIAMYIRGRVWLEDKTKMWEIVPDLMPPTFIIRDQKWVNDIVPETSLDEKCLPWFVKESDRNWGTSVHCCQKSTDCMNLAEPGATYVVQQHIEKPLLYTDGRKCHIKFYLLLVCYEDGRTWELYSYKEGYLSISPNKWDPTDCSKATQVTIIRSQRIGDWEVWPKVYDKCKEGVSEVIRRAAMQSKLEGRENKKQFEIMSADYFVDEDLNVFLFEFNTSPVLKDPQDSPEVHDQDMIEGALSIVMPWEGGNPNLWDFCCKVVAPERPESTESGVMKEVAQKTDDGSMVVEDKTDGGSMVVEDITDGGSMVVEDKTDGGSTVVEDITG